VADELYGLGLRGDYRGEVGWSGLAYRFGHDWNTGSVQNFAVQNAIGVVSPLGDLVAFGSDMMGTRGSNLAANTECQKLRGMFSPATGMTLYTSDPGMAGSRTQFIR